MELRSGIRGLAGLGVILALFVGSTARADWQYTKWGMTPEEVVAASSEAARPATDEERQKAFIRTQPAREPLAVGRYSGGVYDFKAVFYFENRALVEVRLTLAPYADPNGLWAALAGQYGEPIEAKQLDKGITAFKAKRWRDSTNKNLVTASESYGIRVFEISYESLGKGGL